MTTRPIQQPHPIRPPTRPLTAPCPTPCPDAASASDTPHGDDEAAFRAQNGIGADAVMLVPPCDARPPMRHPETAWAMRITAVDTAADGTVTVDADGRGSVVLFTGCWIPEQSAAGMFAGDLVVRLATPSRSGTAHWQAGHTDIEMLLAADGRWQRVGMWHSVGAEWPYLVAHTAAAIVALTVAAEGVTGIVVAGEHYNGWDQWQLADGRTLAEVRAEHHAE